MSYLCTVRDENVDLITLEVELAIWGQMPMNHNP